jgi:hypothetical protein
VLYTAPDRASTTTLPIHCLHKAHELFQIKGTGGRQHRRGRIQPSSARMVEMLSRMSSNTTVTCRGCKQTKRDVKARLGFGGSALNFPRAEATRRGPKPREIELPWRRSLVPIRCQSGRPAWIRGELACCRSRGRKGESSSLEQLATRLVRLDREVGRDQKSTRWHMMARRRCPRAPSSQGKLAESPSLSLEMELDGERQRQLHSHALPLLAPITRGDCSHHAGQRRSRQGGEAGRCQEKGTSGETSLLELSTYM